MVKPHRKAASEGVRSRACREDDGRLGVEDAQRRDGGRARVGVARAKLKHRLAKVTGAKDYQEFLRVGTRQLVVFFC